MDLEKRVPHGVRPLSRSVKGILATGLVFSVLKLRSQDKTRSNRGGWSIIDFDAIESTVNGGQNSIQEEVVPIIQEGETADYVGLESVVEELKVRVSRYVMSLGYDDPAQLLYAGINREMHKPDGGEHDLSDGRHSYFMSEFQSLTAPQLLSSDPDIQSEHWMVNPLKYALEGGTLVVYDRGKLGDSPDNPVTGDDFGTVMVDATSEFIVNAEIGCMKLFD